MVGRPDARRGRVGSGLAGASGGAGLGPVALAVVGGVLAAAFRPAVFPLLARHWLPVSLVVGGTLLLSLAVGLLLARVARLDRKSAALGTLPGAASGMLAMSAPLGADPRLVALAQFTRVIVVVVCAGLVSRFGPAPDPASPASSFEGATLVHGGWAAFGLTALVAGLGAWAGTRLRLPAGALMGPLVLGAFLEELGVARLAWPPGVPQAAYLFLGLWVGLLFDRDAVKTAGRLFPFVLASAVALVIACAGLGARRAHRHGRPYGLPRHHPRRYRFGGDHGPRERGRRAAGPGRADAAPVRRRARRLAPRAVVVVLSPEATHKSDAGLAWSAVAEDEEAARVAESAGVVVGNGLEIEGFLVQDSGDGRGQSAGRPTPSSGERTPDTREASTVRVPA